MSEKMVRARARVLVTVEVSLAQPWGGDCPVAQVMKQASANAIQTVENLIRANTNLRVVEQAKVTAVFTEEER